LRWPSSIHLKKGEGGAETCAKLSELRTAIDHHHAGVKAFRIGRVRIDIYVVGKSRNGKWVGLKTVAVET
jgi:hypothetical protein